MSDTLKGSKLISEAEIYNVNVALNATSLAELRKLMAHPSIYVRAAVACNPITSSDMFNELIAPNGNTDRMERSAEDKQQWDRLDDFVLSRVLQHPNMKQLEKLKLCAKSNSDTRKFWALANPHVTREIILEIRNSPGVDWAVVGFADSLLFDINKKHQITSKRNSAAGFDNSIFSESTNTSKTNGSWFQKPVRDNSIFSWVKD